MKPIVKNFIISALIALVLFGIVTVMFTSYGGRLCLNNTVNYNYPFSNNFTADCISYEKANYFNFIYRWPTLFFIFVIVYILVSLILKSYKDSKFAKRSGILFLIIIVFWGLATGYYYFKSTTEIPSSNYNPVIPTLP